MGKGKSLLMEGIKSNEKIVDHEGVLIEEVDEGSVGCVESVC